MAAKTQCLCWFTFDYYNATSTKIGNPLMKIGGFFLFPPSIHLII